MIETIPNDTQAAAARARVMRWTIPFWIASGLLPALNVAAGVSGHREWLVAALATTGAFALAGIGFGLWAGLTVSRRA